MEFRILGPLEVEERGRQVALPGPQQRALLAILLLHANEVVSTDRLMDALWPDEPPGSGRNALQVRVSQLRKALGKAGAAIETRSTGYVIRIEPQQLDLRRFEYLVAAADGGDPSTAAARLREALALWRGAALSDFTYEDFARAAIARLEELRLTALERRIQADLDLGRYDGLVGELEELVATHPLREHLHGQLMLALYRSGRQAEALDVYTDCRERLTDELGIEPSVALQELQHTMLQQDARLLPAHTPIRERAVLVAVQTASRLETMVEIGELLCTRPRKELIIARAVTDARELHTSTKLLKGYRDQLIERSVAARTAAFVSVAPAADFARLAVEHDVDLVIIDGLPSTLEGVVAALMAELPCDVAALVGGKLKTGPVVVPFVGAEHDWAAVELAAWAAGAAGETLRILGTDGDPAFGGRDASRMLASASITVQRLLGVLAEPLLVKPDAAELVRATADAGLVVVGLSERWRRDGLGNVRSALASQSHAATLLVRRGLRPGGLAPKEQLSRFTWSIGSAS